MEKCWINGFIGPSERPYHIATENCLFRKSRVKVQDESTSVVFNCHHPQMAEGAELNDFCLGAQALADELRRT